MAYSISEGQNDLGVALESFFLYFPFQVSPGTGVVVVNANSNGYFAYHAGWHSDRDAQHRPVQPQKPGAGGAQQSYKITDSAAQGSFVITKAQLAQTKLELRSNELACLHVFELNAGMAEADREWLDLDGWRYAPAAPTLNEDGTRFAGATLTFGEMENQHLYKYWEYHGNMWKRAGLIVPFTQQSPMKQLQAAWHNKQPIPQIVIQSAGVAIRPQSSLFTSYNVTAPAPSGFAMVAQGIFKALAVSALRDWNRPKLGADWVMSQCEECVNQAVEGRASTLESADDSSINSIPLASVDGPVEVLVVEDMPVAGVTSYI